MIKQIIVMRRDLHMRKGKIAAQAGHACVEAVLKTMQRGTSGEASPKHYLDPWLAEGQAKICVYVDGEEALVDLHHRIREAGFLSALIQDAGHTEFHGEPTFTCLATEPLPAEKIDPLTGQLPLY